MLVNITFLFYELTPAINDISDQFALLQYKLPKVQPTRHINTVWESEIHTRLWYRLGVHKNIRELH